MKLVRNGELVQGLRWESERLWKEEKVVVPRGLLETVIREVHATR